MKKLGSCLCGATGAAFLMLLAIGQTSFAGPVGTRIALQTLLGGPGTLEDFEAFSIAPGGSATMSCVVLDALAICNGQGPGLVVPGVAFSFGTGGGQWNAPAYFGSTSKEILSGSPAGQPLVIDFTTSVNAFGVDLRAFTGFADTATMTIFATDDVTPIGTIPGIALPGSGALVFAGWEDVGGIGMVTLTESLNSWSPIIDNLEFGMMTVVPEPSTPALACLIAVGTVATIRGRRSRRRR